MDAILAPLGENQSYARRDWGKRELLQEEFQEQGASEKLKSNRHQSLAFTLISPQPGQRATDESQKKKQKEEEDVVREAVGGRTTGRTLRITIWVVKCEKLGNGLVSDLSRFG